VIVERDNSITLIPSKTAFAELYAGSRPGPPEIGFRESQGYKATGASPAISASSCRLRASPVRHLRRAVLECVLIGRLCDMHPHTAVLYLIHLRMNCPSQVSAIMDAANR